MIISLHNNLIRYQCGKAAIPRFNLCFWVKSKTRSIPYLQIDGLMQDCSISSVLAVKTLSHYRDIIISMMASQITGILLDQSTVFSGADQRKHQSSASLAFVKVIHWWLVNSLHKGPVTQKMFHMIMSSCAVLHKAIDIYMMPCPFSLPSQRQ